MNLTVSFVGWRRCIAGGPSPSWGKLSLPGYEEWTSLPYSIPPCPFPSIIPSRQVSVCSSWSFFSKGDPVWLFHNQFLYRNQSFLRQYSSSLSSCTLFYQVGRGKWSHWLTTHQWWMYLAHPNTDVVFSMTIWFSLYFNYSRAVRFSFSHYCFSAAVVLVGRVNRILLIVVTGGAGVVIVTTWLYSVQLDPLLLGKLRGTLLVLTHVQVVIKLSYLKLLFRW